MQTVKPGVEELLKPRVRIIAPWPICTKHTNLGDLPKVGQIFTVNNDGSISNGSMEIKDVVKYPHLFKKLEWWEERYSNETPAYVKRKRSDGLYQVLRVREPKWNGTLFGHEPNTIEHRFIWPDASGYEIATESEYLDYLNSQPKP